MKQKFENFLCIFAFCSDVIFFIDFIGFFFHEKRAEFENRFSISFHVLHHNWNQLKFTGRCGNLEYFDIAQKTWINLGKTVGISENLKKSSEKILKIFENLREFYKNLWKVQKIYANLKMFKNPRNLQIPLKIFKDFRKSLQILENFETPTNLKKIPEIFKNLKNLQNFKNIFANLRNL